ncbi:MAG: iron-containing alcohol dehydrogenase [Thermoplasmataceae archaeon]
MIEFNYLPIDRVIYGKDAIKNINSQIDRLGGKKVLIVTGHSVSKNRFFSSLLNTLGTDYVVFPEITQHSPIEEIEHSIESLRNNGCDIIVSVGGGSVIDSSKMIRHYYDINIPNIAIPTTLSASEFSHIAGYTLDSEKNGVRDKRITPNVIILDPEAALETPQRLWRSTGIRALDHAIETIISNSDSEIATVMAMKAVEKLFNHLGGSESKDRMECFLAAWYSYINVFDSKMGISHNVGKIIGAKWEIPHGITSCFTLPLAMKFY